MQYDADAALSDLPRGFAACQSAACDDDLVHPTDYISSHACRLRTELAARGCYNAPMRIAPTFVYDDLQHFPSDGKRYEIVNGELFVSPVPPVLHQRVLGNLAATLWRHAREHRLGEVLIGPLDIVFTNATVFEPDIIFVSEARLHIIGDKNLSGPPDLVVEVLSESSSRLDREIKPKQYALHGVPEFWRIDPWVKTVEVFRLQEGNYELAACLIPGDEVTSPLFPGLCLPVSSLWER